jgi:carbon starvation protein CstA
MSITSIFGLFSGAFILLSLMSLIIWILTLIHQGKRGKWAWFILTLLFHIELIYWIVWIFRSSAWNNKVSTPIKECKVVDGKEICEVKK